MATNTGTYTGETGVVKFSGDTSAVTVVASVRGFEISQTADAVESTVMGTTGRTYVAGKTSYTGSMDLYFRDNDENGQTALFSAIGNDPTAIELYPSGETTGIKLSGNVIITDHTITANFDGIVEATVSFTGSGALTRADL